MSRTCPVTGFGMFAVPHSSDTVSSVVQAPPAHMGLQPNAWHPGSFVAALADRDPASATLLAFLVGPRPCGHAPTGRYCAAPLVVDMLDGVWLLRV
jgi:hypothetical protein